MGNAWSKAGDAFNRFTKKPARIQAAGAAALVLMIGPFLPWLSTADDEIGFSRSFNNGLAFHQGELTLLIGMAAIVLVARVVGGVRNGDSGGIAGLGLVATALAVSTAVELTEVDGTGLAWGFYVDAAGAVLLLFAGVALYGAED